MGLVMAVGVDGCATGWVGIVVNENGFQCAIAAPTISALAAKVPDAEGFGIDIPIGLLDDGFRRADQVVRKEVGPRFRSVFMTPPRPVLERDNHQDASALARRLTGSGISRQAYGLRHKILEVDRWLAEAPGPVWEVHPELSFRILAGQPLRTTKDSWNGAAMRRLALRTTGIEIPDDLADAGQAQVDDVLDAAVVAWSCRRLLTGQGRSWPSPPENGPNGRPIAIWA